MEGGVWVGGGRGGWWFCWGAFGGAGGEVAEGGEGAGVLEERTERGREAEEVGEGWRCHCVSSVEIVLIVEVWMSEAWEAQDETSSCKVCGRSRSRGRLVPHR